MAGTVPLHAVSNAQSSGSELTEAATAEASGDEVFIVLQTIETFPADGGMAVFEPGTANEEIFTYASAQADTNRLVGLTRENPVAHSAGVQVGLLSSDSPETSPAPESPAAFESGGDETAEDGSSASSDESADGAVDAPPEVCEPAGERTCGEIAAQIIGDPPSLEEACADLDTIACQQAQEALEGLVTGDPCDPANTGQSCVEYVGGVVQEVQDFIFSAVGDPVDDLCDPQDTGQACDEWATKTLGPVVGEPLGPDCDLKNAVGTCEPVGTLCKDLSFPSDPYVGRAGAVSGVVVGDAVAYCPGLHIVLVVCMEYGPTPAAAIPQGCLPFEGFGRVDGYASAPCLAGTWFTSAEVVWLVDGTVIARGHSGPSTITGAECALGEVPQNIPSPS